MTAKALDDPDDATGLVVRLFLFEGGAETVDAGIAVGAEGERVVGDGVPVRVEQDRRSAEFMESFSDYDLHFRLKTNLTPSFQI